MLVTRLVCDREALNSLVRVLVFSHALAYHIQVAQEFQEVTNKKHARVMCTSVKFKPSGTVLDKQVNAQKENYCFWGSHELLQAHEKVCDENESRNKEKMMGVQNIFVGRKEFIRCVQKACVVYIKRLQVTDSSYIEGTICLVNK